MELERYAVVDIRLEEIPEEHSKESKLEKRYRVRAKFSLWVEAGHDWEPADVRVWLFTKKPLRATGTEGFSFSCWIEESGLSNLRANEVLHDQVLIFLGDLDKAESHAAAILIFWDFFDPCDLTQPFDGGVEGRDQQIDAEVDLSHQQGRDPVEAGNLAVQVSLR